MMQTEDESYEASERPAALEYRVLEILELASSLPPGPLRREALTEVNRLRQRAIELRRQATADLKARFPKNRTRG